MKKHLNHQRGIGVDLDGVIGNLLGRIVQKAHVLFDLRIEPDKISNYNLEECTSLSSNQINTIFELDDLFPNIEPLPSAQESLLQLSKNGWTIHVVTDRNIRFFQDTKRWLHNYGFVWDYLQLVKSDKKANYAQKYGISRFVEDRYDTVIDLSKVCDRVYLFDRTYNQGHLPNSVLRVTHWSDILNDIMS